MWAQLEAGRGAANWEPLRAKQPRREGQQGQGGERRRESTEQMAGGEMVEEEGSRQMEDREEWGE